MLSIIPIHPIHNQSSGIKVVDRLDRGFANDLYDYISLSGTIIDTFRWKMRLLGVDLGRKKGRNTERFFDMPLEQFVSSFQHRKIVACMYAHHRNDTTHPQDCSLVEGNMACGHPGIWIIPATATAVALIAQTLGERVGDSLLPKIVTQVKEACGKNFDADQADYDEHRAWGDPKIQQESQRRLGEAFHLLDPLDALLEDIH